MSIDITTPREDACKYVAGVYESEGSCGAYTAGYANVIRRPQILIRIEMYDKDIIEYIHKEFGGYFTPRKRAAQVAYGNQKAVDFLKAILPYIHGKRRREQAALVFKLHEMKQQKLSRKDVHRQQELLHMAYRINSFNYGGGKRTRRDYTLSNEDIVQATDRLKSETAAEAAVEVPSGNLPSKVLSQTKIGYGPCSLAVRTR